MFYFFVIQRRLDNIGSTARSFLTRPPIGTPRRAISPGEGLTSPRIFPHSTQRVA